jgi:hypothetical protein
VACVGRERAAQAAVLACGAAMLALAAAAVPLARLAHQSLSASGGSVPVWVVAPFGVVGLVVVLLATQVLRVRSPVAVAAATLAAAALFNPVRHRVQRMVDRRFNRARYDADEAVAAFAARLQDAVDPGAVHADLLAAVSQTLQPAHVSVWLSRRY